VGCVSRKASAEVLIPYAVILLGKSLGIALVVGIEKALVEKGDYPGRMEFTLFK